MQDDIIIIREGDGYRLLHGHLRLTNMLRRGRQISVEVKGEGCIKIEKTGAGYLAGKDVPRLPLWQI